MRVLIGCERSGETRRKFRERGHDAWSCDIEWSDDCSPHHIRGDVLDNLHLGWDLMIAHPECRYLANSGAKWLYIDGRSENGPDPARWEAMERAAEFYCRLRDAPIPFKAIENPVMHQHAVRLIEPGPRQVVQPWWFGDPAFKATGFELINLPRLFATNRLTPPKPGTDEHKRWSFIHRMPPGPERARLRSRTFAGIATACADQWGGLLDLRAAA